jgi:hypothetical protein
VNKFLERYSSGRFLEFMTLMKETFFSDLLHTEIRGEDGYV